MGALRLPKKKPADKAGFLQITSPDDRCRVGWSSEPFSVPVSSASQRLPHSQAFLALLEVQFVVLAAQVVSGQIQFRRIASNEGASRAARWALRRALAE